MLKAAGRNGWRKRLAQAAGGSSEATPRSARRALQLCAFPNLPQGMGRRSAGLAAAAQPAWPARPARPAQPAQQKNRVKTASSPCRHCAGSYEKRSVSGFRVCQQGARTQATGQRSEAGSGSGNGTDLLPAHSPRPGAWLQRSAAQLRNFPSLPRWPCWTGGALPWQRPTGGVRQHRKGCCPKCRLARRAWYRRPDQRQNLSRSPHWSPQRQQALPWTCGVLPQPCQALRRSPAAGAAGRALQRPARCPAGRQRLR